MPVAGEGPCLATYFVTEYWQLLMLRVMTGISMGGTIPLVYSLVGDLFHLHQRAAVAAGIQVATGAGLAAGQSISGFVGELPFLLFQARQLLCMNSKGVVRGIMGCRQ